MIHNDYFLKLISGSMSALNLIDYTIQIDSIVNMIMLKYNQNIIRTIYNIHSNQN